MIQTLSDNLSSLQYSKTYIFIHIASGWLNPLFEKRPQEDFQLLLPPSEFVYLTFDFKLPKSICLL